VTDATFCTFEKGEGAVLDRIRLFSYRRLSAAFARAVRNLEKATPSTAGASGVSELAAAATLLRQATE
jgi:hypothetical protein